MFKFEDPFVSENTKLPLIWLIFSLSGSAIGAGLILYSAFIYKHFTEKVICLLGFIYVLYWLYKGFFLLTEGRFFIRKLTFNNLDFEIHNGLHTKIVIKYLEIKSVSNDLKNYKLFNLDCKMHKCLGLIINLKDGRFFRISPHMERIDELKQRLEKIIEKNVS